MEQVNFGYVGINGFTIYNRVFQRYLNARFVFEKPKADWSKLVKKTEELFFYLIEQGTKYGYNVDSILETASPDGSTCFSIASQCSEKISKYIIERGIKVNSITTTMMVPDFKYPDLTIQMMEKEINPHVISYSGKSRIDPYSFSFKSKEAKQLLKEFPRSVHFSTNDIKCDSTCPEDCPSNFRKFYFKNGEFVKMTDENRIGQGGFGSVFKGLFHGKEKAMKCALIGKIEHQSYIKDLVSDLEKNISEIRIQIATTGSGIIVPDGFVRQQNQEKDQNGKWIAKNYNIYIYPLYDCNLYELHEKHFDNFTEGILGDIIHQCFIRKGF